MSDTDVTISETTEAEASEAPTSMKEALKQATNDLLTEDTLDVIEESFNEAVTEKVNIHVEKALIEQDEDHAQKLEKLLESIDSDHTKKLERIVEAITANHTQKLKSVAEKFNNVLNNEATDFKTDLVDKVSNYLDVYLEESVPTAHIEQAMKNNHAIRTLQEMRKSLAVDQAMVTESIRDAVLDGKKRIDESASTAEQLVEENKQLSGELIKIKSTVLLEQKTKDLPETKKNYLFKVLSEKTPEFINENFDYTLKLLEKTEEERLLEFEKQAKESRSNVDRTTIDQTKELVQEQVNAKADKQEEVIEESIDVVTGENLSAPKQKGFFNTYMSELGKY